MRKGMVKEGGCVHGALGSGVKSGVHFLPYCVTQGK